MRRQREEPPEYVEGKEDYTVRELEAMADKLLRDDSRTELCRDCGERGDQSGGFMTEPQFTDAGDPLCDGVGNMLVLDFMELACVNGHSWFQGEGEVRGIGGENPILFEEHLISRRKREIYPVEGVPDPNIVSGIYNRTHPKGRRVNSDAARKAHGASFYGG